MKNAGSLILDSCFLGPGYRHHWVRFTILCLALSSLAGCHKAEEPLSHDEIIQADLAEILELQGLSCDEVVKFEVVDRLDYRVECRSGEQFRIHVSSEGHVQAESQQE
jgi:hypothetical protein